MTAFSSLLSSISGQPAPSTASAAASRPPHPTSSTSNPPRNGAVSVPNSTAGVKRKSDDHALGSQPKVTKLEPSNQSAKPPQHARPAPPVQRPVNAASSVHGGPGAARSAPLINKQGAVSKPGATVAGGTTATRSIPTQAPAAAAAAAAEKPKRGFAALMEKAKASQEASKVAATSGIKHKPVERISRREREKLQKEMALKQQQARKAGRPFLNDRNHSNGAGGSGKTATQKKPQELGYQGTMKKSAPELAYKGTMRPAGTGPSKPKTPAKKGLGQDRYGGYASWSDLDDVEDDEEDYDSEGSSDMEGGFDDVEREESAALRAARKEDQAALEEEERHRREKLERKRRLQALNKNAAAKRRV